MGNGTRLQNNVTLTVSRKLPAAHTTLDMRVHVNVPKGPEVGPRPWVVEGAQEEEAASLQSQDQCFYEEKLVLIF